MAKTTTPKAPAAAKKTTRAKAPPRDTTTKKAAAKKAPTKTKVTPKAITVPKAKAAPRAKSSPKAGPKTKSLPKAAPKATSKAAPKAATKAKSLPKAPASKKSTKLPAAAGANPNSVVAKPEKGHYACLACTYFNPPEASMCEMCMTPKGFGGANPGEGVVPTVHLEFSGGNSNKFWEFRIEVQSSLSSPFCGSPAPPIALLAE